MDKFIPCHRCGGQMFYKKHFTESETYWSWDCLQCGESLDPVILANRKNHKPARARNMRGRKLYGKVHVEVQEEALQI